MEKFAIITGGGKGLRMQNSLPKQFLCINNLPIVMHTMNAFASLVHKILLVLPTETKFLWKELQKKHHFSIPHVVVDGGNTRFESVKNAVELLPKNGLVAIHDAVRPCVSAQLIEKCFQEANLYGNAIAACKVVESIRELADSESKSVDRNKYLFIQTPQVFRCENLKKAYQQNYQPNFTDDASVMESIGEKIHCIEGEYTNVKITFPTDLILAEIFLNKNKNNEFSA